MKKFRPILGISLCIQSLTFFILALINIEKKKTLAATFAALGAAGGAVGGVLLYNEIKERKADGEFDPDDYLESFDDDFDDSEMKRLTRESEVILRVLKEYTSTYPQSKETS